MNKFLILIAFLLSFGLFGQQPNVGGDVDAALSGIKHVTGINQDSFIAGVEKDITGCSVPVSKGTWVVSGSVMMTTIWSSLPTGILKNVYLRNNADASLLSSATGLSRIHASTHSRGTVPLITTVTISSGTDIIQATGLFVYDGGTFQQGDALNCGLMAIKVAN